MPLDQGSTLSTIGSVYLSSDATAAGYAAHVDWLDWSTRAKKVKSTEYGFDGTPHVSVTGAGARGRMTLRIPSCPAALYTALRGLADTRTHYTATLHHPQLGTVARTVEVLDCITPEDDQWASGDPAKDVIVRLESFGAV